MAEKRRLDASHFYFRELLELLSLLATIVVSVIGGIRIATTDELFKPLETVLIIFLVVLVIFSLFKAHLKFNDYKMGNN